ncbi:MULTISPECIES: MerR family transcriptional regulator [unclassified Mycobacterium]|uniref:MerR family transcriptional regulator n=1 Tax=unclassified Mycobacterium TaxID=2642494 RepID=UPI00068C84FE|nr:MULTISPECIES: MerR family transcriptional regulator [unclassified Mycobacterium]SEB21742.1 DNA-binding transcriptional regulator, MerR family [Mycobacterium sp. 283mftsu]
MADVTVEEFTIDELAARTGMTVRTIRFYNESGLLPPPERRGRLAYYGAPHRIRLELVQQLQQHGYTLAAITKVLARLPEGATAHDLAVRAALLTPWSPADDETVDLRELEQRAGLALDDRALDTLEALGAIRRLDDGRFNVRQSVLGAAMNLRDTSVPADDIRRLAGVVDKHIDALANEVTDVVFSRIREAEDPNVYLGRIAKVVPNLRPLAAQMMADRFTAAISQAVQERVAELEMPAK